MGTLGKTKLTLKRGKPNGTAVVGQLFINGMFECYTLENSEVIIPQGSYNVVLYDSPMAGHVVPLLQNVPERSMIEIHSGNYIKDSKGCILVGRQHTADSVYESKLAFIHLLPRIVLPAQIDVISSPV